MNDLINIDPSQETELTVLGHDGKAWYSPHPSSSEEDTVRSVRN